MKIAVIPGDGIGPEIIAETLKVLDKIGGFQYDYAEFGGAAIDKRGDPAPPESLGKCLAADAVLLGAVGGPKWDGGGPRPETGLLRLRKALGVYANLRPAKLFPALKSASPLKNDAGFDILVVRELTGGIYFGESGRDENSAWDTEKYSAIEIERIARAAFKFARARNRRLVSVDKANVLESSRLWRETVARVAVEFPGVSLTNMYVDNAAMQLIKNPAQFDVILTSNMFGDILSDEASQLTGSIGMLPSASLGAKNPGLFEPIHGSAPDIAGMGTANPIAAILSAAMALEYAFNMKKEARAIEAAVEKFLNDGYRTPDIFTEDFILTDTKTAGDIIWKNL
jgi:3-isopropylmalate dehydrogenase